MDATPITTYVAGGENQARIVEIGQKVRVVQIGQKVRVVQIGQTVRIVEQGLRLGPHG